MTVWDVNAKSYHAAALKGEVPALAEKAKDRKYAAFAARHHGKFWGFGISCVGQLGPKALEFIKLLQDLCKRFDHPFRRSFWLARITACVLRGTSRMISEWNLAASKAVGFKSGAPDISEHLTTDPNCEADPE